jgi:hypothetical protein
MAPTSHMAIQFISLTAMLVACGGCSQSSDSSVKLAIDGRANCKAGREKHWYQPTEADFRLEYERDSANRNRQSWSGYWRYVRSFYDGNLFVSGWTSHVQSVLDMIRSESVRDELRAALNDLGRRIAAEWAKDNSIRAIDTSDLRTFGRRLLAARDREDGSGSTVRAEIESVRLQVDERLRRRSTH